MWRTYYVAIRLHDERTVGDEPPYVKDKLGFNGYLLYNRKKDKQLNVNPTQLADGHHPR